MVRRPCSSRVMRRALLGPLLAGLVASAGATPVLLDAAPASACAPTPASVSSVTPAQAATAAAAWLATQQQPDGGFEVAGYPGFETPDAILAAAEAAQTGSTWSTAEAIAAVRALAACGVSPLDWVDAYSQSGLDAGSAAKLVVLVAAPLGLPTTAFDPAGDGGPVDLDAIIASGVDGNGSYGTFTDTVYAALALRLTAGSVPEITMASIRGGQRADGSWDYTGDAASTDTIDQIGSTSVAVIALIAGGAAQGDPAVARALGFLAAKQQVDGGWQEDGDGQTNPNATALAALAIRSAGFNPEGAAWRGATPAGAAAVAAVTGTPTNALIATQDPDGHLVGPYDSFGLNTFGTSQGVHGLLRSWLIGALPLAAPSTSTTTPAPSATTVAVTGRLANSGGPVTGAIALGGLLTLGLGVALIGARRRLA